MFVQVFLVGTLGQDLQLPAGLEYNTAKEVYQPFLLLLITGNHHIDTAHDNQGKQGIGGIHFKHQPEGGDGANEGYIPSGFKGRTVGGIGGKVFQQ